MATLVNSLNELLRAKLAGGSVVAIIAAFLLGVFVGFTPCVYPVLPITVAYIGSIAKGSKLNGLAYSLVYVLGMALVYAALGVITVAVVHSEIGAIWNNGWVLLALANFFLLLALWQLKVIQISVPQFIRGTGERRSLAQAGAAPVVRRALGALMVGAASGLVVGPCTVPGLAAMVALIGKGAAEGSVGSLAFGAVAMFAYSLGLGSLIIICGTFSGFLANLPKSDAWLGRIEKAFAILLILMAEYFLVFLGQEAKFPSLTSLASALTQTTRPRYTPILTQPSQPAQVPSVKAAVGSRAPDWQMSDPDGGAVKLSDYSGRKGVLLVFFATWCALCMEEVPSLIAFQNKYRNQGIELIGVDLDQSAHVVKRFAEDRKVNYKLLLDADSKVAATYGVAGIPTLVGIDAAGVIRYVDNDLPADLDTLVKQLEPGPSSFHSSYRARASFRLVPVVCLSGERQ